MRTAVNDDHIPNGPAIQAGDGVGWRYVNPNLVLWMSTEASGKRSKMNFTAIHLAYSDWQMGRDSKVWGDDCGYFKPERWISPEGSLKQFGQFKFHAFNVSEPLSSLSCDG